MMSFSWRTDTESGGFYGTEAQAQAALAALPSGTIIWIDGLVIWI